MIFAGGRTKYVVVDAPHRQAGQEAEGESHGAGKLCPGSQVGPRHERKGILVRQEAEVRLHHKLGETREVAFHEATTAQGIFFLLNHSC